MLVQMIYTGPDSGSKIYRRVKDSAAVSRNAPGVSALEAVTRGGGDLRR